VVEEIKSLEFTRNLEKCLQAEGAPSLIKRAPHNQTQLGSKREKAGSKPHTKGRSLKKVLFVPVPQLRSWKHHGVGLGALGKSYLLLKQCAGNGEIFGVLYSGKGVWAEK